MSKDTAWGFSSGLPEGNYWIETAEFGYHEDVDSGATLLMLFSGTLEDDDGEVEQDREIRFRVGTGWARAEGGRKAVKEGGKEDAQFNSRSAFAQFVQSAVAAGAETVLRERGTQRDADVWPGLGFRIEVVTEKFKDRQTGEEREFNKTVATEFLGVKGEDKPKGRSTVTAKPAAAASKTMTPQERAAAAKAAKATASNGDSGDLRAQLTQLALDSADFDSFITDAFKIPGVDGGELEAEVLDEDDFYTKARS